MENTSLLNQKLQLFSSIRFIYVLSSGETISRCSERPKQEHQNIFKFYY